MNDRLEGAGLGSGNIARGWEPGRIREPIGTWAMQQIRGHKAGEAIWVRWARPDVPDEVRRQCGPDRTAELVGASDFVRVARVRAKSGKIIWDEPPDPRIAERIQRELNAGATSGRVVVAEFPHNGGDELVLWWARCGMMFGPELVGGPEPLPAGAVTGSLLGRPMVVSDDTRLAGGPDKFGPTIDASKWSPHQKALANLAAKREELRQFEELVAGNIPDPIPQLPAGWHVPHHGVQTVVETRYVVTAENGNSKAVGQGSSLRAAVANCVENAHAADRLTAALGSDTSCYVAGKPMAVSPELKLRTEPENP